MIAWNPCAVRMYGWSEAEALAMNASERIPRDQRKSILEILQRLSRGEVLQPYRAQQISKDGTAKEVSIISSALVNDDGEISAISTTEQEIAGATP